jgi:hypothetical protein
MEDAVRPRIASPGWLVRTRLVRAAAAPSAMRVCARCCGGADAEGGRRGKNRADWAGQLREIRACQQRRGRAHRPSNHPSFYLTLSQTYFDSVLSRSSTARLISTTRALASL